MRGLTQRWGGQQLVLDGGYLAAEVRGESGERSTGKAEVASEMKVESACVGGEWSLCTVLEQREVPMWLGGLKPRILGLQS